MTAHRAPLPLRGHVAVVTGGTSGIGAGLVAGLVDAGAAVAVWSRTARTSSRASGAALLVDCDVADAAQVRRAVGVTLAELGAVDSCFTAAGINRQDAALDTAPAVFRSVVRVNLEGTFHVFRLLAGHMRDRGRGNLVAVSSIAALSGQARTAHYAASKAALVGLTEAAAVELRPHGIAVNVVVPGFVATPMLAPHLADRRFVDRVLPRIPLGRWAVPDDFAALAVHLATTRASGGRFLVDGGYTVSKT
ncbi:SDR family NAD(P)-dependent oxidoreductase [Saccharothrix variisporea]|uniref:NAD(P)-dependent dehydrogenase (Short-subunit alcohol dehydrogenase family) n=1 Tax=Saccharothrix variisporea TaxID=543527 RepID=A0A495XRW9_9PSEU|nr:SDR family NAD(P)-dependent oxidoreductase [Saccharothrix variisporea]RKT74418.1 NAD(P)-dependent dehydrogenase (short-subunit alcohol dehydrogenase family) [Saccharothrix variisporea]